MSRSKPISFEDVDNFVDLGFNISYYRKKKWLTQEELAETSNHYGNKEKRMSDFFSQRHRHRL